MKQYDLVLFDMDGTLLDSGKAHIAMFGRFWEQTDLNTGNGVVHGEAGPTIWDVFAESGIPRTDIGRVYEKLAEFYASGACDDVISTLKFVPQALPLVDRLREAGVCTALVTNTHWKLAERIAEVNGVSARFAALSGSTAEQEDKRERMTALMARFGCAAERTLYVGDNESDARTGRAVGIDCCVVLTHISWVRSYDALLRDARPTYTVFELGKVGRIVL